MNAVEMLELLRDNINEAVESHWSDVNLVRRLNMAQREIALLVAMSPGQWLIKSASVTPSDSVITLPADCSKPIYMEETDSGSPVHWLQKVAYRRVSRPVGTSLDVGSLEAYPLLSTLEINKDSYSTACTLWYQIRVPDLQTGTATTGSAATKLYFPDNLNTKRVDDYYNNVEVEITDGTLAGTIDTITDYVASTRLATITGTVSTDSVFGTISRLPEETHMLIVLDATVLAMMKPSASIDKNVIKFYVDRVKDARAEVDAWLASRIPESNGTMIGDPY